VAIQPDGKILAGGSAAFAPTGSAIDVTRVEANGALDTSFGTGGSGFTSAVFINNAVAGALALQPDGKILVAAGASPSKAYVARYLGQ
jgi:hypothetical protein